MTNRRQLGIIDRSTDTVVLTRAQARYEDTGSAVSDDYTPESSNFNGRVRWVQIDIADAAEDNDHLVTPEERLRLAMARQ